MKRAWYNVIYTAPKHSKAVVFSLLKSLNIGILIAFNANSRVYESPYLRFISLNTDAVFGDTHLSQMCLFTWLLSLFGFLLSLLFSCLFLLLLVILPVFLLGTLLDLLAGFLFLGT